MESVFQLIITQKQQILPNMTVCLLCNWFIIPFQNWTVKIYTFFSHQSLWPKFVTQNIQFFQWFWSYFYWKTYLFNKLFIDIVFTMSLILSEYIEPFSACLIKSVCKIFDVKVTNTHCCSLAKNDPETGPELRVLSDRLEERSQDHTRDPWVQGECFIHYMLAADLMWNLANTTLVIHCSSWICVTIQHNAPLPLNPHPLKKLCCYFRVHTVLKSPWKLNLPRKVL